VFGSAAGWCCLSAAESKTDGEVNCEYRALVKGKAKDERVLGEKPVPMSVYTPQIPHRLARS